MPLRYLCVKTIKLLRQQGKAFRRDIPYSVLFTRTSTAIVPRTLKFIVSQFTESGVGGDLVEKDLNQLDRIKWALRQIYYRERSFNNSHGTYTASLKRLELLDAPISDVPWPPILALTPSGWEAFLIRGNQKIFIQKDGKVWVE